MNRARIFVGSEINPPVADYKGFFQLGEQKHASAGRMEGRCQEPMIASSIDPADGAAGKAAQPIRLKPFPVHARGQIRTDILIKANHVQSGGWRRGSESNR